MLQPPPLPHVLVLGQFGYRLVNVLYVSFCCMGLYYSALTVRFRSVHFLHGKE